MILWRGREDVEATPAIERLGRRAWRWVFTVECPTRIHGTLWRLTIGFDQQVRFIDREDQTPRDGVDYYLLTVDDWWHLGPSHAYYDGPHCGYSLGYLHLNWRGADCKRCHGER